MEWVVIVALITLMIGFAVITYDIAKHNKTKTI